MDINLIILAYAIGRYTKSELVEILKGIGFSSVVINCLVTRGDYRRRQMQNDNSNQISDEQAQALDAITLSPIVFAVVGGDKANRQTSQM